MFFGDDNLRTGRARLWFSLNSTLLPDPLTSYPGGSYSYKTPAVRVSLEPILHLSCAYASMSRPSEYSLASVRN